MSRLNSISEPRVIYDAAGNVLRVENYCPPQEQVMAAIQPTVGRVVWYWPIPEKYNQGQPYMAQVCYVHEPEIDGLQLVNLLVTHSMGYSYPALKVPLWQGVPYRMPDVPFCEWMPYQKGQAAKTDEAHQQASNLLFQSLSRRIERLEDHIKQEAETDSAVDALKKIEEEQRRLAAEEYIKRAEAAAQGKLS